MYNSSNAERATDETPVIRELPHIELDHSIIELNDVYFELDRLLSEIKGTEQEVLADVGSASNNIKGKPVLGDVLQYSASQIQGQRQRCLELITQLRMALFSYD